MRSGRVADWQRVPFVTAFGRVGDGMTGRLPRLSACRASADSGMFGASGGVVEPGAA